MRRLILGVALFGVATGAMADPRRDRGPNRDGPRDPVCTASLVVCAQDWFDEEDRRDGDRRDRDRPDRQKDHRDGDRPDSRF